MGLNVRDTLVGLVAGFVMCYTAITPATRPPCYEDEVCAVREDHDPSHGLTWDCVPLDTLEAK